jgi:hypothetical protein
MSSPRPGLPGRSRVVRRTALALFNVVFVRRPGQPAKGPQFSWASLGAGDVTSRCRRAELGR